MIKQLQDSPPLLVSQRNFCEMPPLLHRSKTLYSWRPFSLYSATMDVANQKEKPVCKISRQTQDELFSEIRKSDHLGVTEVKARTNTRETDGFTEFTSFSCSALLGMNIESPAQLTRTRWHGSFLEGQLAFPKRNLLLGAKWRQAKRSTKCRRKTCPWRFLVEFGLHRPHFWTNHRSRHLNFTREELSGEAHWQPKYRTDLEGGYHLDSSQVF